MPKKTRNRQQKKRDARQEQEKKNNGRSRSAYIAREVISYVVIIIIAVLLASHLNVVVSGSMEPAFYRGDIVATENVNTFYGMHEFNPYTDVHVGDVVVYDASWYPDPVIHRVIGIEDINGSTYYLIKGDNNNAVDPYYVSPSQVTSKVITIGGHLLVIPKIGYITLWLRGL